MMDRLLKNCLILIISVIFFGCAAKKPAPVEGTYEAEKPANTAKKTSKCSDVYTVREGEPIFSSSKK